MSHVPRDYWFMRDNICQATKIQNAKDSLLLQKPVSLGWSAIKQRAFST